MAIGMQIFDAQGNLILDGTKRIGKIVTTFDSGISNSSRTAPELQGAGTPFHFTTTDADYFSEYYAYPDITITGTTVSWSFVDYQIPISPFNQAPRRNIQISVGVF